MHQITSAEAQAIAARFWTVPAGLNRHVEKLRVRSKGGEPMNDRFEPGSAAKKSKAAARNEAISAAVSWTDGCTLI